MSHPHPPIPSTTHHPLLPDDGGYLGGRSSHSNYLDIANKHKPPILIQKHPGTGILFGDSGGIPGRSGGAVASIHPVTQHLRPGSMHKPPTADRVYHDVVNKFRPIFKPRPHPILGVSLEADSQLTGRSSVGSIHAATYHQGPGAVHNALNKPLPVYAAHSQGLHQLKTLFGYTRPHGH